MHAGIRHPHDAATAWHRPMLDNYICGPSGPESHKTSVAYRIVADAHPDVLLRVSGALIVANKAPWSVSLQSSALEEVLIEITLREIPADLVELIRRKLAQLSCVVQVETRSWPQSTDPMPPVTIAAISDEMLVAAFMANIPDHVYFKDRESRFLSVSPSLAQSLGCTVEEVLGKTDFDFFDEALARGFRERELKIMNPAEPLVDQIVKHIWSDGRTTWSLNVAMPMRSATGEIVGVFGTNKDITATKLLEQQLEKANRDLREMSRLAGMAEAAAGMVHNVGNALNSVNVSISLLARGLRKLKIESLGKLCDLLHQQADGLADFLTHTLQGQQVVPFLDALHTEFSASRAHLLLEVGSLEHSVEHIKDIVRIQQSYATVKGVAEEIDIEAVVEDALRMNQGAFERGGVTVRRAFEPVPKILGERGKTLQILDNLLRNAKEAFEGARSATEKAIEIRIEAGSPRMVRVVVRDNGIGIAPENLLRIFAQGITTRSGGHGFGLHSAANAAREMNGSLNAHSDGLGTGASFILELPAAKVEL